MMPIQHDAMQCGIACLSIICRLFGKNISIKSIESICSFSKEGLSFHAISSAALSLGLNTKSYKLTLYSLLKKELPAILHWDLNHFVVLQKISKNGNYFHIIDPKKGKVKYTKDEFLNHWGSIRDYKNQNIIGFAMVFEKTVKFDNLKVDKKNWILERNFILKYISKYKKYIIHIILNLLVACFLQLIFPFLTQSIVDLGIRHEDISLIWLILLGEFMIVAGRTFTDFIRHRLLLHVSMRINVSMISDFFMKLLNLPMAFFDSRITGDIIQRVSDHGRVQSFLSTQFLNIIFSVLSVLIFSIVLLLYDYLIFLIFFIGSIIYCTWISLFLAKRRSLDFDLFECQSNNQNITYELITSMQEIKQQRCEKRKREEWENIQSDLFNIQLKSLKLQQTQEAGSVFINEIKNIIITVLAAGAVINGQISLGAMLAIQFIIGQLNAPVQQFMGFIYGIQDMRLSLERINDIHSRENENSTIRINKNIEASHKIVLSNVSFKYDNHSPFFNLKNISFEIPEKSITAIVGASGSGKSTLIKILLGYYPSSEGEVILGDKNFNTIDLLSWRDRCGVVLQDGVIFSESIAKNIAVGNEPINLKKLEDSARIACIHDFIMSLPLGYETKVGRNGKGLSQGQKQRILIARAVYRNPDYIFLDEATNSLDAKNEVQIVKNLRKFYNGRTVVIVAHRLSTVKEADNIIVLENGEITEQGTHLELVQKKNVYWNLIKNQLELNQ